MNTGSSGAERDDQVPALLQGIQGSGHEGWAVEALRRPLQGVSLASPASRNHGFRYVLLVCWFMTLLPC